MKINRSIALRAVLAAAAIMLLVNFLPLVTAQNGKRLTQAGGPVISTPTSVLPADQIKAKYAQKSAYLGAPTSTISHTADYVSYFQYFQNGAIYWTRATSAHEIHGAIWAWYSRLGGPAALGYPTTDESDAPCGGRYNRFLKNNDAGAIYWKSGIGAFEMHGAILAKYLDKGGPCQLGYPTTGETTTKTDPDGRYSNFSNGYSIYWKKTTGAFEVHGAIRERYLLNGGPDNFLGFPLTDESATADPVGRCNHFENGSIYWTPATGAHEVHGAIREKWESLGWEASWLGYPLTDETPVQGFFCDGCYGRFNRFQGGYIYYYPDSGAVEVRNLAEVFQSVQKKDGLHQTVGERKVLAILYNPYVSSYDINPDCSKNPNCNNTNPLPMPSKEDVEATLFGTSNGYPVPRKPGELRADVSDFFYENSGQKLTLVNAGVIEIDAPPSKQGKHYWDDSLHGCFSSDGWRSGHAERDADAIRMAAQALDFKSFDENGNGKLTPDELAIIVICPGEGDGGFVRPVYGGYSNLPCSTVTYDLKVDGVTIYDPNDNEIFEWFTHPNYPNAPIKLGLPAHELGHLLTDIPDLYSVGWRFDAGVFSRMGANCSACETTHFDPFLKLKAGWLDYTAALGNGDYQLWNVEESNDALILYNANHGRSEYFILEYRRPGKSYDAGRGDAGGGIPNAGIAVWHIIEDPARQKLMTPPGSADNWYRRAVLLVRANGGVPIDDSKALFGTSPITLRWSDSNAIAFTITSLNAVNVQNPPAAVLLRVTVSR